MTMLRFAICMIAAFAGGICLVLGDMDDSPGLGGLGLIATATALVLGIRAIRRGAREA